MGSVIAGSISIFSLIEVGKRPTHFDHFKCSITTSSRGKVPFGSGSDTTASISIRTTKALLSCIDLRVCPRCTPTILPTMENVHSQATGRSVREGLVDPSLSWYQLGATDETHTCQARSCPSRSEHAAQPYHLIAALNV